jgi:hypothetical protein
VAAAGFHMLGCELKNKECAKLQTGDGKLWRDISVHGYRAHNLWELRPIPRWKTPWLLGKKKI